MRKERKNMGQLLAGHRIRYYASIILLHPHKELLLLSFYRFEVYNDKPKIIQPIRSTPRT